MFRVPGAIVLTAQRRLSAPLRPWSTPVVGQGIPRFRILGSTESRRFQLGASAPGSV